MTNSAPAKVHPVPFLDLKRPHGELREEILSAWGRILENAAFAGGPEVQGFEDEFAAWVGTEHSVGVGNGTDALRLALLACGLRPGDEVLTVPHTFIATVEAITQAGGVPVFVDVDRRTGTMDPALLEAAITPRTRVLLPVHLYGQIADMDSLQEVAGRHDLVVVEDAAQAHGASYRGRRAGTFGKAAAFSFYPGKNLGACGEAGAVTTNDPDVAERVRMLRDHGQARKYHHDVEGYNSRLDALQAAALRIKLRHLDGWNEGRRACADRYGVLLRDAAVELPEVAEGREHVWHLFVVRHAERDRVRDALSEAGIATGMHYPVPLHLQAAYRDLGLGRGAFPESERWADRGISLPMFPTMTSDQIERVTEALISATR